MPIAAMTHEDRRFAMYLHGKYKGSIDSDIEQEL